MSVRAIRAAVPVLAAAASGALALHALAAPTAPVAARAVSSTPPPNHVTMITDSVGGVLSSATGPREQLARDVDLDLEVAPCRKLIDPGCPATGDNSPESAIATIRRLGAGIGHTVVIDVGYNDFPSGYAAELDDVMAALVDAGVRQVVWVTLEETYPVWQQSNAVIRAAPQRWPQLTVADWAMVSAGQPWFVDGVHLNYDGAVAFAAFLRPYVLAACGSACSPPRFCGLVRSARRFTPVSAIGHIGCEAAFAAVAAIVRGQPGEWACSGAGTGAEKSCWRGDDGVRLLDRAPVAPVRHRGFVTLANWSFRVSHASLQGRTGHRRWIVLGHSPFCVPVAPREVLVALRLRPLRLRTGCFVPRR